MTPSEIRRLTGYPVFYIGASMFIYFLVTSGIYPYLPNIVDQFSLAGLLSGIYLKVLYALLCLLVAVTAQFILIGKTHGNELRLQSIFSLAYFGVLFACMAALIVYAGLQAAPILILSTITPALLCLGEMIIAIFNLLSALREMKAEEAAKKQ